MPFWSNQPRQIPKIPKEKKEKCRIVTKKTKSGAYVREISGDCSPAQLSALREQNENLGLD